MGKTRAIQVGDVAENAVWHWNEHIEFDIDVKDIARGARLCLAIYAIIGGKAKSKKKANKEVSFIGAKPHISASSLPEMLYGTYVPE